ncbi:hypothetical protein BH23CHL2_BH23CHL2_05300 [soil metagenome]
MSRAGRAALTRASARHACPDLRIVGIPLVATRERVPARFGMTIMVRCNSPEAASRSDAACSKQVVYRLERSFTLVSGHGLHRIQLLGRLDRRKGVKMPWDERSTMDLRREFVLVAEQDDSNFRELCRRGCVLDFGAVGSIVRTTNQVQEVAILISTCPVYSAVLLPPRVPCRRAAGRGAGSAGRGPSRRQGRRGEGRRRAGRRRSARRGR